MFRKNHLSCLENLNAAFATPLAGPRSYEAFILLLVRQQQIEEISLGLTEAPD
jgi:hypothetical protein